MTQITKQREEKIVVIQTKYKEEIASCKDEAKHYAIRHLNAKSCFIRRKNITKDFKIAFEKSLNEENLGVDFYPFGWMRIWFNKFEQLARQV